MDLNTWLGLAALGGLLAVGVMSGELPSTFLNWHGITIVLGGTFAAMLINTPFRHLVDSLAAAFKTLRDGRTSEGEKVVAAVLAVAERVKARGASGFQDADGVVAGGFLKHAAETAMEYNDPEVVERILGNEINQAFDHGNELVNVYRTAGLLAPMFGLLGTLIGIVRVLRQIANPEQVGAAMAVSVTTAFYGIALANMVCVPIAGKLRLRYMEEMRLRGLAAEGVVLILRGTVPAVLERTLRSTL